MSAADGKEDEAPADEYRYSAADTAARELMAARCMCCFPLAHIF